MNPLPLERRAAAAIAAITILTGAAQMLAGGPLLALIATAPPDRTGAHLFATVGMFMVLFGASLLHAQSRREALAVVLLWAALQKLLAAVMVGWGVGRGVFVEPALLVAGFDLASGLLFLDLRRRGG
ncbi:hypothetical protein Lcho_1870 [Leptothrix cholodnii SP-6]|uniref:Uncharacterized protein n=1 Tax=Leptothrix cholodnii (strain ATCC 51168 / LMG 8142 / SP-6) TaxID=395495 RepID=B1Y010_LEPCP|nr:hypothetical protein [Leptothrix cholodnii]ACB34137.1 hypothetical protein Lcho_1870 [Leptothrix cholodnii SP-6]